MSQTDWHGKPYYSLDAWCKNTYQHKCYKVALNAHMSCPNRDGTLGTRGCIFCSAGGSGDFAGDLEAGIRKIADKLPDMTSPCIIAYFQAYTNTYALAATLKKFTRRRFHSLWYAAFRLPHDRIAFPMRCLGCSPP